jgi:hypothetical protein
MDGKAFKVVLALDGIPRYANAPHDADPEQLASVQFRIAPSLDYLDERHSDPLLGRMRRSRSSGVFAPPSARPGWRRTASTCSA